MKIHVMSGISGPTSSPIDLGVGRQERGHMLLRELRDIVLIAERDWLAWDFWQTSSGILTSVPWAQGDPCQVSGCEPVGYVNGRLARRKHWQADSSVEVLDPFVHFTAVAVLLFHNHQVL